MKSIPNIQVYSSGFNSIILHNHDSIPYYLFAWLNYYLLDKCNARFMRLDNSTIHKLQQIINVELGRLVKSGYLYRKPDMIAEWEIT